MHLHQNLHSAVHELHDFFLYFANTYCLNTDKSVTLFFIMRIVILLYSNKIFIYCRVNQE